LAYLANAVVQCYGAFPLDSTILKASDGPLYPTLIWDIDRLVGMRLVRVSDIVLDGSKRLRHVSYAIASAGLDCEERCRMLHTSFVETGNALRSIAMAYSRNRLSLSEESLLSRDGNYADPKVSNGEVVDFGAWVRDNATANSIEKILGELGGALQKDAAVGVNVYSRYLAEFPANGVTNG
jgi:hypothetical protein